MIIKVIVAIIFLPVFCLLAFYIGSHTEKVKEYFMSTDKKMIYLENIEKLEEYAISLEIDKYNKDKILKTIEFEKNMVKREIVSDLGKEEFEKLRKKQ